MAYFQPPSTSPMRLLSSVTAPSKKTSLNSEVPVICWIGRISTPSCLSGTMMYEMPLWRGLSLVRQTTKHQSDQCASDVQTFYPVICHLPSLSSALVWTLARSEPALGSE